MISGMKLNTDFTNRTETLFGKELYARFAQALDVEPVVSVRHNVKKYTAERDAVAVPWATQG